MGKAQLIRGLQIVAGIVVVVLVVGLYKAKSDASNAEAHVRQLHQQIGETEASNRALNAEIAHLESPAHVQELAQQHLDVTPGAQSAALPENSMSSRLPAPRERQAHRP
jgi:cell division protein FtsL